MTRLTITRLRGTVLLAAACAVLTWLQPGVAAAAGTVITPLDQAARTVETVQDFSDYLSVAASAYSQDISKAVELGLVVGRFDSSSTYYAPDALITAGEMINILARNLGAAPTVQGQAAAAYLGQLGVTTGTSLGTTLTVRELELMATQIAELEVDSRANLVVMREALSGSLTRTDGITRAYAVAMYEDQSGGRPSSTTTASAPDSSLPADTVIGGGTRPAAEAPEEHSAVDPVFVLTD